MGKERDLKERTMRFALDVIHFGKQLPETPEGHIRTQLFRAGTGAAANYRAACRGRSKADFIAKLGIVIEESDETDFWLELIGRAQMVKPEAERTLRQEARELTAIFTQSQKTASANRSIALLVMFLAFLIS